MQILPSVFQLPNIQQLGLPQQHQDLKKILILNQITRYFVVSHKVHLSKAVKQTTSCDYFRYSGISRTRFQAVIFNRDGWIVHEACRASRTTKTNTKCRENNFSWSLLFWHIALGTKPEDLNCELHAMYEIYRYLNDEMRK